MLPKPRSPHGKQPLSSLIPNMMWWLISWSTNEILLLILIDHEGLPTMEEVGALRR